MCLYLKTKTPWLPFILLSLAGLLAAIWLRGGTDALILSPVESWSASIHGWFSNQQSDIPGSPESTLTVIEQEVVHHPVASQYSPLDHGRGDNFACSRPRTKPRHDVSSSLVYKWTDSTGQTHMSDTRPEGRIA